METIVSEKSAYNDSVDYSNNSKPKSTEPKVILTLKWKVYYSKA